jgi:hypothetical protein
VEVPAQVVTGDDEDVRLLVLHLVPDLRRDDTCPTQLAVVLALRRRLGL